MRLQPSKSAAQTKVRKTLYTSLLITLPDLSAIIYHLTPLCSRIFSQ